MTEEQMLTIEEERLLKEAQDAEDKVSGCSFFCLLFIWFLVDRKIEAIIDAVDVIFPRKGMFVPISKSSREGILCQQKLCQVDLIVVTASL